MNRKRFFVVLVFCFLALAVGLSTAQTQNQPKPSHPPQPVRTGSSFIPVIPTELGFKAALLASGMNYPSGIGVTPKGNEVFFVTEDDYSIWWIKDLALKYVLQYPTNFQAAKFRTGFIMGSSEGEILRLENKSHLRILGGGGPFFITGLDVDMQTGNIYFLALDWYWNWEEIYKLDPKTGNLTYIADLNGPSWGLAVKGNYIYFTDYYSGEIYKINKNGGSFHYVAGGLDGPTDLCFDKQGNIVVAEYRGGNIARVKAGSLNIVRIATGLDSPYYLQLDAQDNIVFTDAYAGNVWKLRRVQ